MIVFWASITRVQYKRARHLFSVEEDLAFLHVRDFDNLGTYSATAATKLKIT